MAGLSSASTIGSNFIETTNLIGKTVGPSGFLKDKAR
jgi:hypothetical protein